MTKKKIDPIQLSLFGEINEKEKINSLNISHNTIYGGTICPPIDLSILKSKVRRKFNQAINELQFCILDVIAELSDSVDAKDYFKKLRKRDKELNSYIGTNCTYVDMRTATGAYRKVLAGTRECVLRLVQSIPSPKAEVFKQWLAQIGNERLEETANPELGVNRSIDRAVAEYKRRGKDDKWIEKRLRGKFKRRALTDYWQAHGIDKPDYYGIFTNIIHQTTTGGYSVKAHKKALGVNEKANLRDHVSATMLSIIDLSETATEEIARRRGAYGVVENENACIEGGKVGNAAMKAMEAIMGESLVTGKPLLSA